MAKPREHLTHWLRDAYAMEGQALSLLETQASRLETHPEVRAKIEEHLQETHRQREAVEECLNKLGSDPSTLKDLTQKMVANVQNLFNAMSEDEVLKHALGGYSFERFEAASYRMLAVAARQADEPEIAETCERIQHEEEAMGDWLRQQMPILVEEYLGRSETSAFRKGVSRRDVKADGPTPEKVSEKQKAGAGGPIDQEHARAASTTEAKLWELRREIAEAGEAVAAIAKTRTAKTRQLLRGNLWTAIAAAFCAGLFIGATGRL